MKIIGTLLAVLVFAACGGGGNEGCDPAFPFEANCWGSLEVLVTDQNNSPVSGAGVRLRLLREGEQEYFRGVTGADGRKGDMKGEIPGDYDVRITPPAGYSVPSTQANPVRVTLRQGQLTTVEFKLRKD